MKYLILISFSFLLFSGCSKEDSTTIKEHLEKEGIEATVHSSGIYYIIEKEGSGGHPNVNSVVTMNYKGYYLDGEQFDSSFDRGKPLVSALNGLIKGWQQGVPLFQKGGKGTIYIPPHLGYGSNPSNGIRDNASLAFDIELIDFK